MTPDPTYPSPDENVAPLTGDSAEEPSNPGLTLREMLGAVRRRWPLVAAAFAAVVALGAWRTMRQPRIYQAKATVRFQQAQPAVQGIPQTQIRSYNVDPLQSEQYLIKSQNVAERAATMAGLRLRVARPVRSRADLFGDSIPQIAADAPNGEYRLTFRHDDYSLSSGTTVLGTARYGAPLNAAGLTLFVA